MDWIRVDGSMVRHPKVARLSRRLHCSRMEAVGHVVALWCWAAEYYQDGDLSDCEPGEIADGAGWDGGAEDAFVAGLQESGLLDPSMHLHDWLEYQGALAAKRDRDRERMRHLRANSRAVSCDGRATVARQSATVAGDETRRDETRRNETGEGVRGGPDPDPAAEPAAGPTPSEDDRPLERGPMPRPADGVVEVEVRGGPHSTGWVVQPWLDKLAAEYPTVDPLEVAHTLARKVRTGAYTPPPSARGLRRCLASWCEQEHRRPGGPPQHPRVDPMRSTLRAGAHTPGWTWGFSEADQAEHGAEPDWELYLNDCVERYGWEAELGKWPSFAEWKQREVA